MFCKVLGRFDTFWYILDIFGCLLRFLEVLEGFGLFGMFWGVLQCFWVFLDVYGLLGKFRGA